jgi:hypothetical protein
VGTVAVKTVVVVGSIVVVAAAVVFATVAQVDKKSVVDTVAEMVRVAATEEMTPSWYFVVAIVVVDIADMGLVVVAWCIPSYNVTQYTLN